MGVTKIRHGCYQNTLQEAPLHDPKIRDYYAEGIQNQMAYIFQTKNKSQSSHSINSDTIVWGITA